eukprot:s73_g21.t1
MRHLWIAFFPPGSDILASSTSSFIVLQHLKKSEAISPFHHRASFASPASNGTFGWMRNGNLRRAPLQLVLGGIDELADWNDWFHILPCRASELAVQLPDPLILVGILGRWSDHLGRLGGAQLVYRLSSLRQDLQLDFIPTNAKVVDFAEALQAEAEQLSLMSASPTSSTTASTQDTKKKEQIKAAALRSKRAPTTNEEGKGKPRCRFWGGTAGCRRGDSCAYEHSWEGIQRKGRCWHCSGEGHVKPECPYLKKEQGQRDSSGSPTKISKASEEKSKVVIVEVKPTIPPALVSDISGLVKSLQTLKAVHLRYIESKSDGIKGSDQKLALLDGGATHGLRRGTADELAGAEMVTVERVLGDVLQQCGLLVNSTWLKATKECKEDLRALQLPGRDQFTSQHIRDSRQEHSHGPLLSSWPLSQFRR